VAHDADLIPAVALGGIIGALARAEIDVLIPHATGTWPWSTFAVNMLGAFVIGLLLQALLRVDRRWVRPFAITGILGGFTTFSALSMQTRDMLAAGNAAQALAYAIGSVIVGVLAVGLGIALGRQLWPQAHGIDESMVDQA